MAAAAAGAKSFNESFNRRRSPISGGSPAVSEPASPEAVATDVGGSCDGLEPPAAQLPSALTQTLPDSGTE
jgi:hypothetical protein